MSRLGKSFKNRFLRRALALMLAGTMVMSGMPVSAAVESSGAETSVEAEVPEGTDDVSEEAAEDNEVVQKEAEKAETEEQESTKSVGESETSSEEASTAADESKEENTASDASKDTVVASENEESEVLETDTEETSETQGSEDEDNNAVIYTADSAALADGHTYAKWGLGETMIKDDGSTTDGSGNNITNFEGDKGIYKNADGDIIYIDTMIGDAKGKFNATTGQVRADKTKIYIPVVVESNQAKIILYQKSIQEQGNVIYSDGVTGSSLALSGAETEFVKAECSAFSKSGDVYKTELTCTFTDGTKSAIVCIEVKGANNYIYQIISGEEVRDDIYDSNEGNDEALVKYNMEGFANAYGVTGGGMLKKEKSESYYTVSNAVEFLEALTKIKAAGEPAVVEVTGDLNLGSKELGKDENNTDNLTKYSKLIKANQFQALWHPTLKKSGVSDLTLDGFNNLTIFSSNDKGATIKHCNIIVKRSTNIVIRNFVFDELWEWDDGGTVEAEKKTYDRGGYDRNDWDYFCIDTESDGIWIDHCTFYKAYDGVIDVKNAKENGDERVTISWCKFEPKSAPDESGNHPFFDAQLEELEKDFKSDDPKAIYYKSLRTREGEKFEYTYTKYSNKVGTETTETLTGEDYEPEDIVTYTMGQKKTHLLGQSDGTKTGEEAIPAKSRGIKVTLANNSYKNSMDRMPRLRFGVAHEYNCTLDSSELDAARKAGSKATSHLVSNGAISTMGGYVFLENCYIDGIQLPLNSGNGESLRGYIGQTGSIYNYKNDEGEAQELTVVNNSNNKSPDYGKEPLTLTKDQFKEKLPDNYGSYQLCAADDLSTDVVPYAGAGSVKMTAVQWLKTSYGADNAGNNPDPDNPDNPNPDNPNPDNPDNPPAETNGKEFRASSLEVQTELTADLEVNEFYTITKGCEIAESKATINDIYFTKCIKLSTKGSKEHSIQITSPGKGTVTVYAAAGTTTAKAAAGTLNLLDETGNTVVDSVADITDAAFVTLNIPKKGVYYIASADSELYVYGIDLDAEEDTGDDEPVIEFSLRADELTVDADVTQLTSDHSQNGFLIKAITANPMPIEGRKQKLTGIKGMEDVEITKCIRINKPGNATQHSIHFTAEDTGALTVYAASANSTTDRAIGLYKKDGTEVPDSEQKALGSGAKALVYKIDEVGDYFIAPKDGGIRIWYIAFSNKVEDPTPPTNTYAPEEVDAEWTTLPALVAESVYDAEDAKDASKVMYNLEGYAGAANVTGGGLIKEGTTGYYKATNEEEFLKALKAVQNVTDKPNVIEITTDLNLGKLELKEKFGIDVFAKGEGNGEYSGVIKAYTIQPRMHPTLKKTGVSFLNMHGFQNLTIFSKNGATIKHAGMKFEDVSTKNIIIRNLTFDELWEWDEGGLDAKGKYQNPGDYDINDWDYMVIDEHAEGIWIDHCTFYKSYDGLIDVKNNSSDSNYYQRVTISWCEFLPGSKDNVFFNEQMKWLEDNIDNEEVEIAYYRQLRNEHMKKPNSDINKNPTMGAEDVWWYAYGQKKAHLFGSDDKASEDKVMRVTLANNYYKNAMSRLPRLRFGKVHEYNCVFDSQQMNEQNTKGNPHITGNGAISACNGEMLLENNYIRGVRTPLRSGYSSSSDDTGYINFINGVYYMDGSLKAATITESSAGKKITDETKFKEKLPEGYVFTTRDATQLYKTVVPYAGAGKLDMTTVQWEATNYGTNDTGSETPASPSQTEPAIPSEYDKVPTTPWDDPDNPDNPNPPVEPTTVEAPTASPAEEAQFPSTGGEVTLGCTTDGADIYYTISDTEAGLTDPADAENTNRVPYVLGTKIPITKETYIWAVAIKGGKTSEPLRCHYTVLAEGAVAMPIPNPEPAKPVESGTKVTLSVMGDYDNIYYTKGTTPDATADPTKEDSGREPYNNETGIIITEAVTIKAVAKKGDTYSDIATFTYTIKTNVDPNPDTVAPPVFSKPEGVVEKGEKITIDCTAADADIYYTTDGNEPKAEAQFLYTKGTEIVIDKTMTIRAIAVKDGVSSTESKATYTIKGTENPDIPLDPDDPGNEKDAGAIWITGLKESYPYTGAKIIPDIKVWDCDITSGDRLLAPGIDYTVAYKNNTKPGKADVIVSGKGNYVGKNVTASFQIAEATDVEAPDSVKGAKIDKIKDVITYTGKANHPDFKLTLKGKSAVTYTYDEEAEKYVRADGQPMNVNVAISNNINKGTATILVSGAKEKGKTTSVKTTFKILPADLSKATVEATAGVYAVKGAVPGSLTVTYDGKRLVNGIDYTVKYGNNKKAGAQGTITVTGKGNYTKKAPAKTFTISKLDMSNIKVDAVTACEKMAAGKVKATVVDGDGNALKASQYTLKIYKEKEGDAAYGAKDVLPAGATIYVEAVAKDTANLDKKTERAEFKVGKDISKAKVVLADKNKKGIEYTGSPIMLQEGDLTVTLKDVTGSLKLAQDYEIVAYSNNINKGTATAVIKGKGDYSGTKTIKFKIKQRTMKNGYIKN